MIYPDFNELLNLQLKAKKFCLKADKASSLISGDSSSKRYGSGLEFSQVREYVYGDDIRNIDWRVTARTGKPHSKLFEVQSEQTANIVVDMNPIMHFGSKGTFKSVQASRVAALVAWIFNQNNNRVGGVVFGGAQKDVAIFPPSKSRQSLLTMLQHLSINKVGDHHVSLDKALSQVGRMASIDSRIYVISDFAAFDSKLIKKDIKRFCEKGCKITFLQITDQRDYEIPPMGRVCFVSAGNKIEIDTNSIAGKERYFKIWQDNHNKLEQLTNEMGVKLIKIKTDSDAYLKLSLL